MAKQARAAQQSAKSDQIPPPPAVKAQAAQLAIAQKAIEMRRKPRQARRVPAYRRHAYAS
jgi:hypothetical protein